MVSCPSSPQHQPGGTCGAQGLQKDEFVPSREVLFESLAQPSPCCLQTVALWEWRNASCRIEGAGVGAPWCQPCECNQLPTRGWGSATVRGAQRSSMDSLFSSLGQAVPTTFYPPGPAVLVGDGSTRPPTLPGARALPSHAEVSGFPKTPRTGPQQGTGTGCGCGAPPGCYGVGRGRRQRGSAQASRADTTPSPRCSQQTHWWGRSLFQRTP